MFNEQFRFKLLFGKNYDMKIFFRQKIQFDYSKMSGDML